MIIYSVTIKIDLDAHDAWLAWMRNEHMQEVLDTGKFVKYKLHRLLAEDESDGITYNVHYYANSMADYFEYRDNFATELQQKGYAQFKGKFVAFRTLLKEVD
ncbi:MAG: DUF4286 family protein [Chitinophagales bacterium]|nr:DUF4286 family protein [Chitinophagales bacterium]